MEEAKKMTCYKRLIFKQFVHVSGLCGPQFLSYLPKRFTHLCRALYGDAILVHRFVGNSKYQVKGMINFDFGILFGRKIGKYFYRVFSLTWSASMQIYWDKRKRLHKKRPQLPQDWFGTPTWPPFHCFGTPIWPP